MSTPAFAAPLPLARPPTSLPARAARTVLHACAKAPVPFTGELGAGAAAATPVGGVDVSARGLTAHPTRAAAPAWLRSVLRARGPAPAVGKLATVAERGAGVAEGFGEGDRMPGRGMEAWRFTDLKSFYRVRYGQGGGVGLEGVKEVVEALVPEEVGGVLVFVDGVYCAGESRVDGFGVGLEAVLEAGGYVGGLEGYTGDVDAVLAMLEKREVGVEAGGPFAAVGSALARDVCVIDLPAGLAVEKPIAVVCLASGGVDEGTASAAAPRIAVRTGENASVQLLETHAVLDGVARPWACVISGSAFEVGPGASVEHYVVNDMPVTAHHLAHVHADVAKDGVYKGRSLMLGAQVCRVSLGVDLNGVGARGEAFGVMIADGKRVTDLHSRISHNAPSCTSNQYQKNIASGNGRVVFSGKILVQKVAQETDSQQLCRSMLLSNKARVDAMPVLEISADQVKCTHGATVSDLSQEELFYCQTRGISESKAQELLLASFALDVLADCPFQMLKERTSLSARALIPSIQKVDINDRTELYQSI